MCARGPTVSHAVLIARRCASEGGNAVARFARLSVCLSLGRITLKMRMTIREILVGHATAEKRSDYGRDL